MAFDKMVISNDAEKRLTLDRLKHFMSLDYKKEEDKLKQSNKSRKLEGLESAQEKINRLKTNEICEEIKAFCEKGNCTAESVFFMETEAELRRISKLTTDDDPVLEVVKPKEPMTRDGIKKGLERLSIFINYPQAE